MTDNRFTCSGIGARRIDAPMHAFELLLMVAALVACTVGAGQAQVIEPKARLAAVVETETLKAGHVVRIALKVRLEPRTVHVQSNKPRDPSLIPTVLTVEPPSGVTVQKIVYPLATDLTQEGLAEPLAVYGPEFTITVHLKLGASIAAGELVVPARLRYQACDELMCFPPTRAETRWTLDVS